MSNAILVVDDEAAVRAVLARALESAGYEVDVAPSGEEALRTLRPGAHAAALIDFQMPGMDGLTLCRRIQESSPDIGLVLVTGTGDVGVAIEALRLDADDFILKPFQIPDVLARVAKVLETQRQRIAERQAKEWTEKRLDEALRELESKSQRLAEAFDETVSALINTLEAKDRTTEGHSRRVSHHGALLAKRMGLDEHAVRDVRLAGLLHDVGKIAVPEAVLNKPGPLTDREYSEVKLHPVVAQRIVQPVALLRRVAPIIRHHHERADGAGYPDGLHCDSIPLESRIIAVVDAFDSMTSRRPYRSAMTADEAMEILRDGSGKQWDEPVVSAFLQARPELEWPQPGEAGFETELSSTLHQAPAESGPNEQ